MSIKYQTIKASRKPQWFEDKLFPLTKSYLVWHLDKEGRKPPLIPRSTTKGQLLSLAKALSLAREHEAGIGIVFNETLPLIGLDIDKCGLAMPIIKKLLEAHPTYVEESPSGQEAGSYRIFYTIDASEKQLLRSKTVIKQLIGQVEVYSHSGNYLTITGQPVNRKTIATIGALDLIKFIPECRAEESEVVHSVLDSIMEASEARSALRVASFQQWAKHVPIAEDDPMVKYVCRLKDWSHYDYWLYGLMSIHAIGIAVNKPTKAKETAIIWSQKDEAKWDEKAFETTWNSFSDKERAISLKTYVWFYKTAIPQWEATLNFRSRQAPKPIAENFKLWAEITNAHILEDPVSGAQIIQGDTIPPFDISLLDDHSKLARATLTSLAKFNFAGLEKDNIYKSLCNSLISDPKFRKKAKRSFIGQWALSKPWDGKDRISWLIYKVIEYNTDEPERLALYRSMIRRWLWAAAKTFEPSAISNKHFNDGQEGLLVLASRRGRIGKTEFGRYLVPYEAPSLYVVKSPDKYKGFNNDRDFIETIHNKLIVCLDEVNKTLTQQSVETLKEFISASTMWYRRAWGVGQEKVHRTFAVYATTNHESLLIPRDGGARRFWWVPVKSINIGMMARDLDAQQLWAQAHYEMVEASKKDPYGYPPWVLPGQESQRQMQELNTFRSKNNLEEWLHDIFISDPGLIEKYYANLVRNEITALKPRALRESLRFLDIPIKYLENIRALNKTLEHFLQSCMPAQIKVRQRVYRYGLFIAQNGERYWLLPPLKEDFEELKEKGETSEEKGFTSE